MDKFGAIPYVKRLEPGDLYPCSEIKIFPIVRSCHEMTIEELEEFTSNQYGEEYALKKINSFKSLWGLYSFVAEHGTPNSLQWLLQKGFDPFFYFPKYAVHRHGKEYSDAKQYKNK